jgi:hypothetical protein
MNITWCLGLRRVLDGEVHVVHEGMRMGFCLEVPPANQIALHGPTAHLFVYAHYVRGLGEAATLIKVNRSATTQTVGFVGSHITNCGGFKKNSKGRDKGKQTKGRGKDAPAAAVIQPPTTSGGPSEFWNWFHHKGTVKLNYLSAAARDAAVRKLEAFILFDSSSEAESALAIHSALLQPRNFDLTFVKTDALAEMETADHLWLYKLNRDTLRAVEQQYGLAALDVPRLAAEMCKTLAPFGVLPGSVRLVVLDNGSWDWEKGIRVCMARVGAMVLRAALLTGKSPFHPGLW